MRKKLPLLALLIILLIILSVANVLAQDAGVVEFTNLPDGATVSELTTLTGSINFPDFLKYELFLKSGEQLLWVANSHSPVSKANLARLDPRVFPSGSFQLVVRQVHPDSNYTDVTGPTITIDNPNGVPLPYYPEIEPSFLYPVDDYALVRASNCAGEDFFFDYQSLPAGGSAGQTLLPAKTGDSICIFSDFILKPALYRGTAKGLAQTVAQPIEFLAEAGKVYDLTYHGGGHHIEMREIPGDSKSEAVSAAAYATPAPTKAPATVAPATVAPVPAKAAEPKAVLPTSGQAISSASVFGVASIVLIVLLIGGGILAARRKKQAVG